MADKVTEMLDRFTALTQQEKQLSADTDSIYKEYNDYLKSCDEDLNKKIAEIREKMSKLDYYLNYAREHANASELEAAVEPFETDDGHLESIRQTIKLDSHNDPNAETLYTKVTGMKLFYERKIEETRHLIEGSKVQAKRQYDTDLANLNRRKMEQDDQVRAYIRSDEFKDYLRLLTFDKSAFNSTGTAKIPDNSTISLGQRRVRLTVPMDIEQDLAFISNNEYNSGARTIGAPFRISMKSGSVVCLDFDERNKQYLLGGIQRLLLNAVKYFGQNLEDVLFCEPEGFGPECLGHIAAFGRGAYPFIIIPNSSDDIERRVEEYFTDIERYPASEAVSRIVVMHCFPEKYSDSVRERVVNLCKNAGKYGVLVVLTHFNVEDEGELAEIRESGISVRSKNGGFWVERLRESLFWYSAPSDIPMEIRRDFVENRHPKPKPVPEPIPEPAIVEQEAPEELEIPEEPIPEIEEVAEDSTLVSEPDWDAADKTDEPTSGVFEDMNEPESVKEPTPEPKLTPRYPAPSYVANEEPEPTSDMFEDMNEPESVEEPAPEPKLTPRYPAPSYVANEEPEPTSDVFEDMNESVEESTPEPKLTPRYPAPSYVANEEPEPTSGVFEDMNEPEPAPEPKLTPRYPAPSYVANEEPEPTSGVFENMNEPVEETAPEPAWEAVDKTNELASDVFEDMNESVEEPAPELKLTPRYPAPSYVANEEPEPTSDMFENMNEPVEEPAPEPKLTPRYPAPSYVANEEPEPTSNVFEDMNEPVEEPAPEPAWEAVDKTDEPASDVFEDMNEPVEETAPEQKLTPRHPAPDEIVHETAENVTITPIMEIHETLPPVEKEPAVEEPVNLAPASEPVAPSPAPAAESPAPEPVRSIEPQPVHGSKRPVNDIPEIPVNTEPVTKSVRKLPNVPLGLDVNEDPVTFDISGNVTYICGKPCAERRRLVDAILLTIITNMHPDDAEMWMFDCGGDELLHYADNPAPHIRYLVNDASSETTFDLIDTLDSEMSRRAELLAENHWKKFEDIPENVYLPQMIVVVNEFPKMLANMETAPKFFGRSCMDKAKDLFRKCDEYGIHFVLIGETFAVNDKRPACFEGYKIHSGAAVNGCDEGVQTLFASLRLYENEIASLKRIPENCAFVADINSQVGLTLVRFTGKLPEFAIRYRAVAEYSQEAEEYVDKHAMVGDKRDAATFDECRDTRAKMLAERAEDEIMIFLGEPCRFKSQYPVRLCEDFGENILAIMPRREQQVGLAVIVSALRSLIEQGSAVEIIASRSNPLYTELCAVGIPEGVSVFESEQGVDRICEIAAQIAEGSTSPSVEIVLGGDLIFAAMHAEDKIGDLKNALVKGSRHGVHFMFTTTSAVQMSTGFLSMFRHKIVLSCPQNDAEKVLRDTSAPLPENAFRLSDDYDELTIIPYVI